jgi:hypothetical protein
MEDITNDDLNFSRATWDTIVKENKLTEKFIHRYQHFMDWKLICQYQKLSEPFIENYLYKVDGRLILKYQKLSKPFIEKYKNRVDWAPARQYQNSSKSFIEKSHQRQSERSDKSTQPERSHERQSERSHECCCCFGSHPQNQIAKCNNNHIICKDCINIGTETSVGEMKLFKCPHGDNCDQSIDESIINKFVNDGLAKAYSETSIFININSIDGLHKCIYCDYAAEVEGEPEAFFCRTCKKNYCFKCGEDLHEGQKCKQKFHDKAEELTKKHTISCCGRYIVRGDACNQLTCTCGKSYCWYCKIPIPNDHSHFTDSNIPVGGKCPLFTDPPKAEVIKSDESMEKKQRENQERLERIEQRRLEEEQRRRLEQRRIEEEQRRRRIEEEQRRRRIEEEQRRRRIEEEQRRIEEEYKHAYYRSMLVYPEGSSEPDLVRGRKYD